MLRRAIEDVLANVWEAHEAKQFLGTAKAAGPQQAAFYSLALDTGIRKSELCGLQWSDLSATGTLTVKRQLVKPGGEPIFGPVKNKSPVNWNSAQTRSNSSERTDATKPS